MQFESRHKSVRSSQTLSVVANDAADADDCRMDSRGPYVSSSSLTGRNKESPSPVKDSLTSSGRCIRRRSSSVRTDQSPFIAGEISGD